LLRGATGTGGSVIGGKYAGGGLEKELGFTSTLDGSGDVGGG